MRPRVSNRHTGSSNQGKTDRHYRHVSTVNLVIVQNVVRGHVLSFALERFQLKREKSKAPLPRRDRRTYTLEAPIFSCSTAVLYGFLLVYMAPGNSVPTV